ncbi:hypothetical protein ALC62_09933 [Cyphomyrmex costatus]|uniref:Uncharacterized protein n=1 Tax=Cyphomyrmex costatus TaxID=456900 RepID=A0A151IER0_9HYME|nr:hypothetical protein ALC62_09933 [Cyphomyrmex costatus]
MANAIMFIRGVKDSLTEEGFKAETLLCEHRVMRHKLPLLTLQDQDLQHIERMLRPLISFQCRNWYRVPQGSHLKRQNLLTTAVFGWFSASKALESFATVLYRLIEEIKKNGILLIPSMNPVVGVMRARSWPSVCITLRPHTHNPAEIPRPPYSSMSMGVSASCRAEPSAYTAQSPISGPIALLTSLPPCAKLPNIAVRTCKKANNLDTSGCASSSAIPSICAFSTSAWATISNGLSLLLPRKPFGARSALALPLLLPQGVSEITDNAVVSLFSWQRPKFVAVVTAFSSLPFDVNSILALCRGTTYTYTITAANVPANIATIKLIHHGIFTVFLIIQKILTDTIPLSIGLANQDAAMLPRAIHFTYDINYVSQRVVVLLTPAVPRHTSENPTVAPTMECVPEIGSRNAVANSNQIPDPARLDNAPSINSFSWSSYNETSNIPLRIVSETCSGGINRQVRTIFKSQTSYWVALHKF